jgi:DNA polymerase
MRWTERQAAMLDELGLRLPPVVHAVGHEADVMPAPVDVLPEVSPRSASPVRTDPVDVPRLPATARGARPAGIEVMDWPALRQAVADCTACKLCRGRRQTVFGVGNLHAHWMVVGEAPGEQEDIQGEPFVGKSGQLLDNMLRALGLGRHDMPPPGAQGLPTDPARQVYIANTLKCRPPGNRNPQPDELAQCEHFLIRQIELVKPRIILAMGRFAVQSLLRSEEPIGRLRMRVHRYQGVPLIVTYHPAYLLRNPEDKARAWDDLCLAAETADAASAAS